MTAVRCSHDFDADDEAGAASEGAPSRSYGSTCKNDIPEVAAHEIRTMCSCQVANTSAYVTYGRRLAKPPLPARPSSSEHASAGFDEVTDETARWEPEALNSKEIECFRKEL